MQKPGFIISAPWGQVRSVIELIQELDSRGFPHVFCPHNYMPTLESTRTPPPPPWDCISLCTAAIQATKQIKIASGIAVTYTRHPAEMAAGALFMNELSNGRFYLGLGPGHDNILHRFGFQTEKPIAHLSKYLTELRATAASADKPLPPIILAAVRHKMTHFAGEAAEGVVANMWPLSQVQSFLKEIPAEKRDRFIIGNLVPTWVSDDRREGMAAIKRTIGFYMSMPNYVHFYREAGYAEEADRAIPAVAKLDWEGMYAAVSDKMAEDMGIFGTPKQVREKVEEWQAAGINWLTLSALQSTKSQYESIMSVARLFE